MSVAQYILAIDQGTTGSRAVVYDKSGQIIASAYEEFPQYFPHPGWVEHDPDEIWTSVNHAIQKTLKKIPKATIAVIGITNQRETTIIWDRITSKPIYNAIVWQCRRTAPRCDALKKQQKTLTLFRKITGLPIDAYFSATKIEWILKNISGALTKAREGRLLFGTTDSWILWKLTGGAIHATDYTNASRTMLFDIKNLTWSDQILKKFHIPAKILPRVQPSSGFFGKTVKHGLLPAGIPIAGMAGDQQAALFGQTCFEPGTIKNTYGTGCFLLLNTGKRRVTSRHGLITTLGCDQKGKHAYVLEGSVFVAGAAIQWLRDGLNILESAMQSECMAASVNDNAGVYFVPALVGLGAPYWDQDARGSIYGLTRGTTKNHLVRAALEAMCYQTKDVVLAMQKDSGLKIKDLRIDGGAVKNNFLCQFQSDILGIRVIRPKVIETTSLGAAYLAGLAVHYWKNADEIKKVWKQDHAFHPKRSASLSRALYQGWLNAVARTLSSAKTI